MLDDALPLVESAEALMTRFSGLERPSSQDARDGLRLRLRLVNVLGPLNELRCSAEHASIQKEAANLLTFYLHMITRSFEVRFSTLSRADYEVVAVTPTMPVGLTRYARLVGLRATLAESQRSLGLLRSADSEPAGRAEPAGQAGQAGPPALRGAHPQTLVRLILLGLACIASAVAAAVWAPSAARNISFTCGDLGCQSSDPALYLATTAASLSAPALLAAGIISTGLTLAVRHLLVRTTLFRETVSSRRSGVMTGLVTSTIWLPGIAVTVVSAFTILYSSQASESPFALCVAATCAPEYALLDTLRTLAPAGLLGGIVCLAIAALRQAFPETAVEHPTQPVSRPPTDPTVYMRPKAGEAQGNHLGKG